MVRATLIGGAAALAIFAAAPAFGQSHGQHESPVRHGAHTPTAVPTEPSTAALKAVNARMHAAMDIDYSGDADVDFARAMIPHHQGAIDMAKVALAFGKDPNIRKLAEAIIAAQESEIGWIQEWLKKNAPKK